MKGCISSRFRIHYVCLSQFLSAERHGSLTLRILLVPVWTQIAQPHWSWWFAEVSETATALHIKIGYGRFLLIFYNSSTTILLTFDRTAKRTLNTLTGVTRSAPTHRTAPHNWKVGSGGSAVHFCSQWLISRYQAANQRTGERLSFNALHRTPHLQTAARCTSPNTNSKQNQKKESAICKDF